MAMTRTYVKTITIEPANHKNIESLLDALILKETEKGASFRGITSCMDESGGIVYTIVFEHLS